MSNAGDLARSGLLAVERAILDREFAELALQWMMNPQSPRVPNL